MKQGLINNNAEPGDKVCCPMHGNGVVSDTNHGVRVQFGNWNEWYTVDGRLGEPARRTLRFGHDPAFDQPEEMPFPELGTPCLFSDTGEDGDWGAFAWFGVDYSQEYPFKTANWVGKQWVKAGGWKHWKPWPYKTVDAKGETTGWHDARSDTGGGERWVNKVQESQPAPSDPWQPKHGELCLMGDYLDYLSPEWYSGKNKDGSHVAAVMRNGAFQRGQSWRYCFPYRAPIIED